MARPRLPRDAADLGTIQRTVVDRMRLPGAPPGSTGTLGDPLEVAFGQRLRTQLLDWPRMNVGAFCREAWRIKLLTADEADDLVLLVDKYLNGGWRKRGELRKGDGLDTEELEVHLVETWGQGRYRLTPEWHGKEYPPRSRVYELGDDPTAGAGKKDTQSLIAEAAEAVGQTVTLSQLKRLEAPTEEEGMKVGDLAQLITALKGSERAGPDPLVAELLRQNQESQKAILEELKALREKGAGRAPSELAALLPALAPMLGTLLRPFARNPDALASILGRVLGMAPPEPEKGVVDSVMEYLGPMLQSPTAQSILAALAARLVAPPLVPGAAAPAHAVTAPFQLPMTTAPVPPQPQNGGEPAMPVPLNQDQAHAVRQFVAFVAAGDFSNGFACLEMFPQGDPMPGAPLGVNLGELFLVRLNQIKRTADPRVAVPALRALAPELDPVRAAEFIAYAQRQLIDQEAQEPERGDTTEMGVGPETLG